MGKLKAVVLFSGGFDSMAIAEELCQSNKYDEVHLLYINYGNTNKRAELLAVHNYMESLEGEALKRTKLVIERHTLAGNSTLQSGESTGNAFVDEYVPARNMQFISLATAYAEVNDVRDIYFGAIDNEGAYYSDSSPLFVEKMKEVVFLASSGKVTLNAPHIYRTKLDILQYINDELGKPSAEAVLHLSMSCNATDSLDPCGVCNTCLCIKHLKNNFS